MNSQHNQSAFVEKEHMRMYKKYSLKDKPQPVAPFKVAKISFRASRFNEFTDKSSEKNKTKPFLESKQINSRNLGFTIDHNSGQNSQGFNNQSLF